MVRQEKTIFVTIAVNIQIRGFSRFNPLWVVPV